MSRVLPLFVVFLITSSVVFAQPAKKPTEPIGADHAEKMIKGLDVFKKHVKPILETRCLRCHGGKKIESDFDLSDREGLIKGGQFGNAVVPGKSRESQLVKLIQHVKEPHMPDGDKKLADAQIAKIIEWIDLGAPYDLPLVTTKVKGKSWTERVLPASAKKWWAFEPLGKAAPPQVKDAAWCNTSLDRFIRAKQEAASVMPNRPASTEQLIRRAYFDLIGLPPTPEEVDAYLLDARANPQAAFAKVIDKLLVSPHYGERWGRHWLDLARFAESHGFEHDYDRPTAFHYRDFVIEALNQDLPFNKFVQWQIAGDEYEPNNNLALKATGFLAAGVHSTQITKSEVEKHRYDEMDDKLSTITTAMLGLTVGCARCHDHKYDPIPQRDYYRMLATFTTTVRSEVDVTPLAPEYVKAKAAFDVAHKPIVDKAEGFAREQLATRLEAWEKGNAAKVKIPANIITILKTAASERKDEQKAELLKWYRSIDAEAKKLDQQVAEHLKKAPKAPKMLVATEGLPAVRLHTQGEDFFPQTYFLRRGDPANKEGTAAQGFLQVLMPAADAEKRWQSPPPKGWRTSYQRRAFAEWLTDVEQGAGHLLARVIVNRLWQHHLGRGIVVTPSDYGVRGEPPTHPELLDHLANELIKNDWSLKAMHKLIMTSAVYQQSTAVNPENVKLDRDNKLYWRQPARRLEAEIIRDVILAVSGELDTKQFGPGTLDEKSKRRSIYFTVKRSKLVPMMVIFDAPEALSGMAERPTTTIAPQALHMLNNPQVRQAARSFAKRIATDSPEDSVRLAYRIALARSPSKEELADGVAFVRQQMETYPENLRRESALADFCQVLLCLNEFIYVD